MSNLQITKPVNFSNTIQQIPKYYNQHKKCQHMLRDRLLPAICEENYYQQPLIEDTKNQSSTLIYQKALKNTIFCKNKSIFDYNFKNNPKIEPIALKNINQSKISNRFKNTIKPFKNMEIRDWYDNFYSDLLDWNNKNIIAIGTRDSVYLYNPYLDVSHIGKKNRIRHKIDDIKQQLTSLSFNNYENKIAFGYTSGVLRIYDFHREKYSIVRNIHQDRVSTIEWKNYLFTGSRDRKISLYDIRMNKAIVYYIHDREVIGIKENDQLIASGGTDKLVNIYDCRSPKIIDSYNHKSRVRGLCWSRNKKILYSGGGKFDQSIKIWQNGRGIKKSIDTGSPICKILYSKNSEELITCHGYPLNQINIWNEQGERLATLNGHYQRVLYAALSPNGQNLITGAGDQSLLFWNLFQKREQNNTLTSDCFKDIR